MEPPHPLLRVMALHALAYCERLFYLEEVEELRIADDRVYAGRALHAEIEREEAERVEAFELESPQLGLRGRLDALRRRDGTWIPYEHKRGRARRGADRTPEAWETDRLQIAAYAMLLEKAIDAPVTEGRLRYHADGRTVRVRIDERLRASVRAAIERATILRASTVRPPVTSNERLCVRCSLAPVCLPEEERLARDPAWEPLRLAPADDERQIVHVIGPGARIGRSGEELHVAPRDATPERLPVNLVGQIVIHGGAQITTQALHLCAEREVAVSWVTGGGRFIGTLAAGGAGVQRRIRQYEALTNPGTRFELARRLVTARIEGQLRFLLRATRGHRPRPPTTMAALTALRAALRSVSEVQTVDALRGHEGDAAANFFRAWEDLLAAELDPRLRYEKRTRRPPRDRVSAILGFGYALLLRDVTVALLAAGLDTAFGFYHHPRSAAPPLSLDLMELFRVPMVDMPVVASLNRGQWDPDADFHETPTRIWLSEAGRRKLIELYERRRAEQWRHSVVGYSLAYGRMIELEARLLEKEWSGTPGLFARFRLR